LGCLALIAFLSLIPGQWQERTALPGPVEHFIAYLGAAAIIGLGNRLRYRPTYLIIGLSTLSAALEVLQHWSPGRDPQWVGFFASSAGGVVGALFAYWAHSD
jgi:VanZ family protein